MKLEDYYVLNEMLGEFRREAADLEAQIDHCARCIQEADAHLKAIENQEPEDRKVFSPRKTGTLYKEEIERIRTEKAACEKENQYLSDKKSVADGRVKRLSGVLERQEQSFTVQGEYEADIRDAALANLEELWEKIEKSRQQIERNPIQARQDFAIIAKLLRDTIDQIRDMAE